MIKWLIRILWGDDCKHEWKELHKTSYQYCDKYLFCCNKCGRFSKQKV